MSAKEPRRLLGMQRRQSFQLSHMEIHSLSLQIIPPGKYSVQSHRLVILSWGTVIVQYSSATACQSFVSDSSGNQLFIAPPLSSVRITCAGAVGVSSWPKIGIHFGRKMYESAASL